LGSPKPLATRSARKASRVTGGLGGGDLLREGKRRFSIARISFLYLRRSAATTGSVVRLLLRRYVNMQAVDGASDDAVHDAVKLESLTNLKRAIKGALKVIGRSSMSQRQKMEASKLVTQVAAALTNHVLYTLAGLDRRETPKEHVLHVIKCLRLASYFLVADDEERTSSEVKSCCLNFVAKAEHRSEPSSEQCQRTTVDYVEKLTQLKAAMVGHAGTYEDVVAALFSKRSVRTGYLKTALAVLGVLALTGAVVGSGASWLTAKRAAQRAEAAYAKSEHLEELANALVHAGSASRSWGDTAESATKALRGVVGLLSDVADLTIKVGAAAWARFYAQEMNRGYQRRF
jgi:hypothetical protein